MNHDPFIHRVIKRLKHLKKWATRSQITCFRVYHQDLPDYPIILDYYDGDFVLWFKPRKRDETPDQIEEYQSSVQAALIDALGIAAQTLHCKSRQIQKGTQQYQKITRLSQKKIVIENQLKFELNLSDYLDVGLFLDHRKTRHLCQTLAKGKRVLNLFAYTGSFTCYAIAGAAKSTVTVDMNPNYIQWAKRNLVLNGFDQQSNHQFVVDDCLNFLKNCQEKFDLIICDPPTFSNSKRQDYCFSVLDDYPNLIENCQQLLAKNGHIIFSCNAKRFTLDPEKLAKSLHIQDIRKQSTDVDFQANPVHYAWLLSSPS